MHTNSCSVPRFSGSTVVCTALTGHAKNGMVHLLISHTTDPQVVEFSYVLRSGSAAAKATAAKRGSSY